MQNEIDTANTRATEAENTLKGFEGKNFDEITKERDGKQKEKEAKKKVNEQKKSITKAA